MRDIKKICDIVSLGVECDRINDGLKCNSECVIYREIEEEISDLKSEIKELKLLQRDKYE